MADETAFVINANDQVQRYLRSLDEAAAADDVGETRRYINEAISQARDAMDSLDDAVLEIESPEASDPLDDAMNHLGLSMDLGEQALESPDEEVEEYIPEMRRHGERALDLVQEAGVGVL